MEFITWKDVFSVKIESIDNQHKKLVEMINELYKHLYSDITDEYLNKLINELEEYSVYHFEYEEGLMEKFNFEFEESHKESHEKFKEDIKEYKEIIDAENTEVLIEFASFLKNWLLQHIMGTDKKYTKLFQANQVH